MAYDFFGLCAVGLAALAISAGLTRVVLGAGPRECLAETVSWQAWLWLGVFSAGLCGLVIAAVAVHHAWLAYEAGELSGVWSQVIPAFAIGALLLGLAWLAAAGPGATSTAEAISPEVRLTELISGIPDEVFADLGVERFPNLLAPDRGRDNLLRVAHVVAGLGLLLLLGVREYANDGVDSLRPWVADWLVQGQAVAGETARFAPFVAWCCAVLLALALATNHDYTMKPYFRTMCLNLVVATVAVLAGGLALGDPGQVLLMVAVVAGALAWRAARDLAAYYRFQQQQLVSAPIVEGLGHDVPYLPELASHVATELGLPAEEALVARIAEGCRQVERRGWLVPRAIARFMRVGALRYRDFAAASLRYLTVARSVRESGASGTSRALQNPAVPAWDLLTFPLHPPDGYCSFDHPVSLGAEWDRVTTCPTCWGTGQVDQTVTEYETEYYTEYYTDSNGNTQSRSATRQVPRYRTVKVTCGMCGGLRNVAYRRTLVTHWRSMTPMRTSPRVPISDLVEGAEELTLLHVRLVEGLEDLNRTPSIGPLGRVPASAIADTLAQVRAQHAARSAQVVEVLGGQLLYRADFRLLGFRAVRIAFQGLGSRVGWFFGNQPEFYFPRLPTSNEAVLAAVFAPPLFWWVTVQLFQLAQQAW